MLPQSFDESSMNSHEQRENFAALIKQYEPAQPAKIRELLELRDSIAEARKMGASYEIIRSYLRKTAIAVSADTVARFCHQILSEPKRGSSKQRPRSRQPDRSGTSASQLLKRKGPAPSVSPYQSPNGPRIVNPKEL
jgi:negative regulator of sigma E activity